MDKNNQYGPPTEEEYFKQLNKGKSPNGVQQATALLGGLTTIAQHGVDNINSVNGDLQYDALKAMRGQDYAPGSTTDLFNAYNSRPTIKTDYTFEDVGGKNWLDIGLGSIADSFEGFKAGMSTGNPIVTAITTALGGVTGLTTGIYGRNKAEGIASDLNDYGRTVMGQDIAKLANASANSSALNMNFAENGGRIYIKPENRGKFTALKERTGHSTSWFKEHGTPAQKKMATFALNARKWHHDNGGFLNTHGVDWTNGLTYFNTGGSHSENPLGGILQGFDEQGIPNMVEEGEVKYNDYIYSKKEKLDKKYQENNDINDKYIDQSFAEIAEELGRESEERPNDPISKRTLEENMMRLAGAQEEKNMDKAIKKYKRGGKLNQQDLMYLAQAIEASQEIPQDQEGIISDEEALNMQDQRKFAGGGWLDFIEATPVYAGAYQVLSDALGWTNKNNFTSYEPYRNSLSRARDVSASPIGGYMGYTPIDRSYAANMLRSQSANSLRSIENLAGSNRGTAMVGALTNNNNYKSSIGDLMINAAAQDLEDKLKVTQYNTGIREKEVQNSLEAQKANQSKDLAVAKGWLDYGNAIQRIIDANDEARGHNISQLADLVGKYGRSLRAFLDREAYIKSGAGRPGAENSYYGYYGWA